MKEKPQCDTRCDKHGIQCELEKGHFGMHFHSIDCGGIIDLKGGKIQ